jgi:microcin C transport system permease protein
MLTKNTFVEEMRKQYVLVARAKGLSAQRCSTSTSSAMR